MGKFANSKALASSSLGVLKRDKKLAAIPLVSGIVNTVIVVVFCGGAFFTLKDVANPAPGQDDLSATPFTWAVGIVGILVLAIVAQFFAATLIAAANTRLEGNDGTLGDAAGKAFSRAGSLIGFSAINATVGVLLQALRDKAGIFGDILAGLGGAAWNVVTWLVLPIIIIEGIGPIAAIKRSVALLKQTWGENLIAQAGLSLIGLLLMLPGILLFGALSFALPFLGIPLVFIWVVAIASIMSALSAIYRTALYRFAVGLPAGPTFSQKELEDAFATGKSRR